MSSVQKQFIGVVTILTLLGVEVVSAPLASRAATTPSEVLLSQRFNQTVDRWSCGEFNITVTSDNDNGTFKYQAPGLTLTNGILDGQGDETFYTFRNGNYYYRVTKYDDNEGQLEVVQTLRGGGQKTLVRESCTRR